MDVRTAINTLPEGQLRQALDALATTAEGDVTTFR